MDLEGEIWMKFQSTRQQVTSSGLTVYNDGFGMVKEKRMVPENKAVTDIQFLDVASEIEADSVLIEGLQVLEKTYSTNFISKEKLLDWYIGQVITVNNAELGEAIKVRLLSTSGNIIVEQLDTGEITIDPIGQLILPSLPEGLLMRPTLVCKIVAVETATEVGISYLTKGLKWQANYVAEIRGSYLNLTSWIQLSNDSGIDFFESRLKLTSGNVNRYKEAHPLHAQARLFAATEEQESFFEEHTFEDYHMYSMARPVTILQDQTKQIRLMKIQGVDFRKVYKVESGSQQAEVRVEFYNNVDNKLGVPLPKGIVKVYEQDSNDEMEFIGEDAMTHKTNQQKVSLAIGKAFDISSESREKKRSRSGHFDYVTYVYELQNKKSESVRIEVTHQVFEQIWQMESSSHDYELKQSNKLEFRVHLAAGKKVEVEFTYKVDRRTEEQIQ